MKLYHTNNDKLLKQEWLEEDFYVFLEDFNKKTKNALGLKGLNYSFEFLNIKNIKNENVANIYKNSHFPLKYRNSKPTLNLNQFKDRNSWLKKEYLLNYIYALFEESKHFIYNHKEYFFENSLEYRLCHSLSEENLLELNNNQIISFILTHPLKFGKMSNIKGSCFNQIEKLSHYRSFSFNKEKLNKHIQHCLNIRLQQLASNSSKNLKNSNEFKESHLYNLYFTDFKLKKILNSKTISIEDTIEYKILLNEELAFEMIQKNNIYKKNKIKIISIKEKQELFYLNENKEYNEDFQYYYSLYKDLYLSQNIYGEDLNDLEIIKNKIISIQNKINNNKHIKHEDTIEYWIVNKLIDINKKTKEDYRKEKVLIAERDYYVEFLLNQNNKIRNNVNQLDKFNKARDYSILLKIDKKMVEKIANENESLKHSVLLKNKNINKKIFNSKEFLSIMYLIGSISEEEFKKNIVNENQYKEICENDKKSLTNNNSLRGNKIEEIVSNLLQEKDNEIKKSIILEENKQKTQNIENKTLKNKNTLNNYNSAVVMETRKETGGVKTDVILKNREEVIGLSIKSSIKKQQSINLGDIIVDNLIRGVEQQKCFKNYSIEDQNKIKFFLHFYHNPMAFVEEFKNDPKNEIKNHNIYFNEKEIKQMIDFEEKQLPRLNLKKIYETEIGKLGFEFLQKNLNQIAILNLANNENFLKYFLKIDLNKSENKEDELYLYKIEEMQKLLEKAKFGIKNNQFCLKLKDKTIYQLKTYVPSSGIKDKNSFSYFKNKGKSRGVLEKDFFNFIKPILNIKQENILRKEVKKVNYIEYKQLNLNAKNSIKNKNIDIENLSVFNDEEKKSKNKVENKFI